MEDMLRFLAFIVLLLSVLFLPIWISVILALAGMVYFTFFLEAVVLFLISDLFFGIRETRFLGMTYLSFIIALCFFVGIEFLKKKFRLYSK